MKNEILKKTAIYRILAFTVGVLINLYIINLIIPLPWTLNIGIASIQEAASILLYYTYEHVWRRYVDYRNLEKGANVLMIQGNGKVKLSYDVIENLGEGKLIIKVV